MSPRDLVRALETIRAATSLPVVVDLQGAKMRFGFFEPREVRPGEAFALASAPESNEIPLPHPELFQAARPGLTLSCDDDRIRLRIDEVHKDRLTVTALAEATLRPRKGVNLVEHPVHLEDLTAVDVEQIEVARGFEDVSFACSFMRDGREAEWIRSRAPGATIVGKVERAEAVDELSSIAERVDVIWICRGDLGAQLGLVSMARWVSSFRPLSLPVPTLIAGQVLEHLTHHADPTRSEVCHLHDLLQRGYAGIVLSDETAIGCDPLRATQTASDLIRDL
jgi:pyruvate kinase